MEKKESATPLLVASYRGDWLAVRNIIRDGKAERKAPYNVNRVDQNGVGALALASFMGWESVIEVCSKSAYDQPLMCGFCHVPNQLLCRNRF